MSTNILLFLTVTFWGLSFIATKMALDFLDPARLIALRFFLGVPVLYIIMKAKKINLKFDKADVPILGAASIILVSHFLIQSAGLVYTSATNTAWLIATIPIFIAIGSYFFLGERLSRYGVMGLTLATGGVILLVSRGKLGNLDWMSSTGDWLILASCLTWTIYTIITRKVSQKYNTLSLTVLLLSVPGVCLLGWLVISTPLSNLVVLPPRIILALLFLGLFCLGLAHWFWMEGLARKGASQIGVFLYIEPVVTTLAAGPLLGEPITVSLITGALLIVGGVYLVQKKAPVS